MLRASPYTHDGYLIQGKKYYRGFLLPRFDIFENIVLRRSSSVKYFKTTGAGGS